MKPTIALLLLAASILHGQGVDTAWVAHAFGPDSLGDYPVAVATDPAGDILVTGVCRTATVQDDIVTMKYSSEGNLVWRARYDGPAHKTDHPTHLVVDRYGYVYVAGTSRGLTGFVESNDGVILKYYPTGQLAWARRYEGEAASQEAMNGLAIDSQRNVLAAIRRIEYPTLTMNELLTIKLYPTGDLAWVQTFPVHRWSECYGMYCDEQGNPVLGGWLWQGAGNPDYEFFALMKYTSDGSQLRFCPYRDSAAWSANSEVFTMDDQGNIFAAGQTEKITGEEVFATGHYDADGTLLWHREFRALDNSDPNVIDIAADRDGNVTWLAMWTSDSTGDDMVVAKYLANGDSAWVKPLAIDDYQEPVAVAVDDEGSVYALANTRMENGDVGLLVVKLDAMGTVQWTMAWGGDGHNYQPYGIALDRERNVVVCASADFAGNTSSIMTVKLVQSDVTIAATGAGEDITPVFVLEQNYPNPFNHTTTIWFRLPTKMMVDLAVYDILGRQVDRLRSSEMDAGTHRVIWDASTLPSGCYICRLTADGSSVRTKMLLAK